MKTLTPTIKTILLGALISILMAACSVEKKEALDPADSTTDTPTSSEIISDSQHTHDDEPPMITDPENIVLPPADYIPQPHPEPELVLPKPKKELTKQQLFSGALDAHNRVRAKHGLKPLKWSDKLAAYSQEWADHLGKGNSCKMYHRSGSPPYGENLYISSAIVWSDGKRVVAREKNRVTIQNVVKAWADEEPWYNYKTNSCLPGKQCGHYTQIVWRDTTEVGCAVKFCGDQSQNWVCSYNPPGNFTGQRPY